MAEVRTPAESLVPSSAIRSPRHRYQFVVRKTIYVLFVEAKKILLFQKNLFRSGFRSWPVLGRLRLRESSTRSRLRPSVKENKSLDFFFKLTTNCLRYVLTSDTCTSTYRS